MGNNVSLCMIWILQEEIIFYKCPFHAFKAWNWIGHETEPFKQMVNFLSFFFCETNCQVNWRLKEMFSNLKVLSGTSNCSVLLADKQIWFPFTFFSVWKVSSLFHTEHYPVGTDLHCLGNASRLYHADFQRIHHHTVERLVLFHELIWQNALLLLILRWSTAF